ncbi:hypothetical protein BDW62DRAFT_207684 [Aspergillus aurantiobrunneus]
MSSRRPHPKSRSGCKRCKEKHIKCDESWPVCGACARYNPADSQASVSPSSSTARTTLTLWEFELLHHWILRVAESFDVSPGFHNLWREHMVRDAMQHDFILHMMLILSALHLALTNSPLYTEAHRDFILQDCSDAINCFQHEAQNIDASNCYAVGAFTYLFSIYAMALPLLNRDEKFEHVGDEAALDEMVHILSLIRTYSLVRDSTSAWIQMRGLKPWAEDEDLLNGSGDYQQDQDLTRALDALLPWVNTSDDEPFIKTCNTVTINAFKKVLEFHVKQNIQPLLWATVITEDYLELLKQRNPMAMCSSQWWCANWGIRLVSFIASILPERYAGAIAYPCHTLMRTGAW